MRAALVALLRLGAVGALLSTLAVFGARHWMFDLIGAFRVQYVVLLLPALLVAAWLRRGGLAALFALVIALHGATIAGSLWSVAGTSPVVDADATPATLRLVSANLLASNTGHAATSAMLQASEADLLVLLEYTPEWQEVLAPLADEWPHRVERPQQSPFGIALWSRLPLDEVRGIAFDLEGFPSVEASVAVGETRLHVVATHPVPPMSARLTARRDAHLDALGAHLARIEGPRVVAGDFNVTPWSASFARLVEKGGLVDARRGIGLRTTWPTYFPPASIPIDHVLVGGGVRVLGLDSIAGTGSDHRALVADLHVGDGGPR